jgi:uncharacterized protein
MSKDLYAAIMDRRSYYSISKESPVPDDKIVETVKYAVKHAPSAFNSQSGRAVVLLGRDHNALWDIVLETLKKIVPAQRFAATSEKIGGFAAGHGTVLFFEDQAVVEGLQAKFVSFKDNFPIWSLQSSGMLQYVVWASLEAEGLGASLQHYNPLIDDEVKKRWNLPQSFRLISQMPFGAPMKAPDEKEFLPVDDRVLVFHS